MIKFETYYEFENAVMEVIKQRLAVSIAHKIEKSDHYHRDITLGTRVALLDRKSEMILSTSTSRKQIN